MERLEFSRVCPAVLGALDENLAATQHLRPLNRTVFTLLDSAVCLLIRIWQLLPVQSAAHSRMLTAAHSFPLLHQYWSACELRDLFLQSQDLLVFGHLFLSMSLLLSGQLFLQLFYSFPLLLRILSPLSFLVLSFASQVRKLQVQVFVFFGQLVLCRLQLFLLGHVRFQLLIVLILQVL